MYAHGSLSAAARGRKIAIAANSTTKISARPSSQLYRVSFENIGIGLSTPLIRVQKLDDPVESGFRIDQTGAVLNAVAQHFAQQIQRLDQPPLGEGVFDVQTLALGAHQPALAQDF